MGYVLLLISLITITICDVASSNTGRSSIVLVKNKYLKVDQTRNVFKYNGKDVFLNGANQPWVNYGNDFGGNRPSNVKSALKTQLKRISDAGGNAVRMWIFCEAKYLPIFNWDGTVQKSDSDNSLKTDIVEYLDMAASYNIFVILCLWNGAVNFNGNNLHRMLTDSSGTKLQSFINKVLIPLVKATKGHNALGAFEIVNEPEGSLKVSSSNSNKGCTDTSFLSGKGPPWTNVVITAKQWQRFINKQAAAIHSNNGNALVTVGSWSEWSNTGVYGKNLWSNYCLKSAGGMNNGYLDFYQIHSYAWQNKYNQYSPFRVSNKNVYKLDKPVIIGEFGVKEGGGTNPTTIQQKYLYIYNHGFNGALAWAMNNVGGSDGWWTVIKGIKAVSQKSAAFTYNGDDENDINTLNATEIILIVTGSILFFVCIILLCTRCILLDKRKKNAEIDAKNIVSDTANSTLNETQTQQIVPEEDDDNNDDDDDPQEIEINVDIEQTDDDGNDGDDETL